MQAWCLELSRGHAHHALGTVLRLSTTVEPVAGRGLPALLLSLVEASAGSAARGRPDVLVEAAFLEAAFSELLNVVRLKKVPVSVLLQGIYVFEFHSAAERVHPEGPTGCVAHPKAGDRVVLKEEGLRMGDVRTVKAMCGICHKVDFQTRLESHSELCAEEGAR